MLCYIFFALYKYRNNKPRATTNIRFFNCDETCLVFKNEAKTYLSISKQQNKTKIIKQKPKPAGIKQKPHKKIDSVSFTLRIKKVMPNKPLFFLQRLSILVKQLIVYDAICFR